MCDDVSVLNFIGEQGAAPLLSFLGLLQNEMHDFHLLLKIWRQGVFAGDDDMRGGNLRVEQIEKSVPVLSIKVREIKGESDAVVQIIPGCAVGQVEMDGVLFHGITSLNLYERQVVIESYKNQPVVRPNDSV